MTLLTTLLSLSCPCSRTARTPVSVASLERISDRVSQDRQLNYSLFEKLKSLLTVPILNKLGTFFIRYAHQRGDN